jgi:hypothetical protein
MWQQASFRCTVIGYTASMIINMQLAPELVNRNTSIHSGIHQCITKLCTFFKECGVTDDGVTKAVVQPLVP